MTNLDSILKSRDITLPTKVRLVKAMVFPVVMSGCESWTRKNAKCQRIDAFELWCWRRLLRVSWTSRRSNQSILKEISPEYSLEGLMLKLKLQYFGHLMATNWLIGKDPGAGKDWRWEEKGMTEDEVVGWHHRLNGPCSMSCGSLEGRGVWGRMDTCIWMAEPLCYPPETITTLLIGYTSVKNKKSYITALRQTIIFRSDKQQGRPVWHTDLYAISQW